MKSGLSKQGYKSFRNSLKAYGNNQIDKAKLIDIVSGLVIEDTESDLNLRQSRISLFADFGFFVGPNQEPRIQEIVRKWQADKPC